MKNDVSPPRSRSRRDFLAGSAAAMLLGLGAPAWAEQKGLVATAPWLSPTLLDKALLALSRHHAAIWSQDVIAIADFSVPSMLPRFHLVDILAGTTTSLLVAHGKGSDPEHSAYLQHFSNEIGSNATSEGAYVTGERYSGIHGASRRLIGLDETNGNAEIRAIVIHAAWYVDPDLVAVQGRMGRSDGCFVFSEADIAIVLDRLGQGRLLYAGKG